MIWTYLTKVIVVSGFYVGCTGVVMGHAGSNRYFVELTCKDDGHVYSNNEWMERRDLKKDERVK